MLFYFLENYNAQKTYEQLNKDKPVYECATRKEDAKSITHQSVCNVFDTIRKTVNNAWYKHYALDTLTGQIQVDETSIGKIEKGLNANRPIMWIIGAIEVKTKRVRMTLWPDRSTDSLVGWLLRIVEDEDTTYVHTDGLKSYVALSSLSVHLNHYVNVKSKKKKKSKAVTQNLKSTKTKAKGCISKKNIPNSLQTPQNIVHTNSKTNKTSPDRQPWKRFRELKDEPEDKSRSKVSPFKPIVQTRNQKRLAAKKSSSDDISDGSHCEDWKEIEKEEVEMEEVKAKPRKRQIQMPKVDRFAFTKKTDQKGEDIEEDKDEYMGGTVQSIANQMPTGNNVRKPVVLDL